MGGKTRTDAHGEVTKGWDHDPPAQEKLVPFGILMVATGALMLLFGSYETSDAWVDALQVWWRQVRRGHKHVKRVQQQVRNDPAALEISLDTKAKVGLGDYARGGKNPDGRRR